MISRAKYSLLNISAMINEVLVPHQPAVKNIRFNPKSIKFLFLFVRYFRSTIRPNIIDIITRVRPRLPLRISSGVKVIKRHNIPFNK